MSITHTEDLTGQVDGVATVFTTPAVYIAGSLVVIYNGATLQDGEWTELTSTTFQWNGPAKVPIPLVGDSLRVQYEVDGVPTPFELVTATGIDPTT